ncbi:MAG: hypothetical protein JWL90_3744 [Chthoniobacteraceae bacterium]|nr:hypothetical protein [Chthoniobacteraceae bacterium]
MLKRLLLIGFLALVFVCGVVHLFALRFEHGDVYPEYSSLRTDPLGCKAFYDAFREQPGLTLRRNYRPIVKLQPAPATTLIYAGTPARAWWGNKELEAVEAMAAAGSRVVITFVGVTQGPSKRDLSRESEEEKKRTERRRKKEEKKAAETKPEGEPAKEPGKLPEKEAPETYSFDQVAARWGFAFKYLASNVKGSEKALPGILSGPLNKEISWHSVLYFEPRKSGDWETLYSFAEKPVLMERAYGKGSIVLAAESYFLSNEAMLKEPNPELLAWLVGSSSTVVVDEESHGVSENPGIATLVGKYGLQGAVAVLAVLALLFIWKNATPLVPPFEELESGVVLGKETTEGFINLLRRGIAPGELLQVCAGEWKKAFDRDGTTPQSAHLENVMAAESVKSTRSRDAVAAYCELTAGLAKPPGRNKKS